MPLRIVRQDITKMAVDAIVNATNRNMIPGGGVDAAIHKAAGPKLLGHCKALGGISVGEARITPAFDLPCKYVIHTAGPRWNGGRGGERVLLRSCYSECLRLAVENNLESIAFPLIASGAYGYPKDNVLIEAEEVIAEVLEHHEIDVYLVVYDKDSYSISKEICNNVQTFIDNFYIKSRHDRKDDSGAEFSRRFDDSTYCCIAESFDEASASARGERLAAMKRRRELAEKPGREYLRSEKATSLSLEDMIEGIDKSFADTLLHYIDKKGITDVEAYKGANVSRKVFSKLRCEKNYKPSKITAISYAISLHLSVEEAKHLLLTAGYALSRSYIMDVIIEYFLASGAYKDIHEVNRVLDQFDQPSLGCSK